MVLTTTILVLGNPGRSSYGSIICNNIGDWRNDFSVFWDKILLPILKMNC